jgi:hypothetical protein
MTTALQLVPAPASDLLPARAKRLRALRSRISTDHGTCGSNRFLTGVIFSVHAREDRASR